MMDMSEERRKEIALAVVEQYFIDNGIPGGSKLRQDAGNILQRINSRTSGQKLELSLEGLMEFYLSLVPKVIGNVFAKREVSLTTE